LATGKFEKKIEMNEPSVPVDAFDKWDTLEAVILRCLLVGGVVVTYLHNTDELQRASGLLAACAFSFIETFWTSLFDDGKFCPHWIGHTTWAQFYGNVVYTPVLLFAYRAVFDSMLLRILLFPFNIWALELGKFLTHLIIQLYVLSVCSSRLFVYFYVREEHCMDVRRRI